MGYELTRFQGEVDEELICPICSGVLEEPVQVCNFFSLPMTCNFICEITDIWLIHIEFVLIEFY